MRHKEIPVIIGNAGKMGSMLSTRWQQARLSPIGCDREANSDGTFAFCQTTVQKTLAQGTVVILCVPVTALQETLAIVAPCLQPGQLLMDITSVKELPMQWMEQAYSGPVVGAHPLFGPKPLAEDMRVALTPGAKATEDHCQRAEHLFTLLGCATFRTTPAQHDRGVGFAQSLNFAVCSSFFATLARNEEVRPFLTPSFKRLMDAARKHLTVDTAMFCEFSNANPHFHNILQTYRQTLDDAETKGLEAIAAEAAVWYRESDGKAP